MAPPHAEEFTTTAATTSASGNKAPLFKVQSPNVKYTESHIISKYAYANTIVTKKSDGSLVAQPVEQVFEFKTERKVPRVG